MVNCQETNKCSKALDQLQDSFTCGNEHNACSQVTFTDECSIYCCPMNQTITVNRPSNISELMNNRDFIKPNVARITHTDHELELEEVMDISKRAACDPENADADDATTPDGQKKRDTVGCCGTESTDTDENVSNDKQLEVRATRHCSNCGRIKRAKYGPVNCNPSYSVGYRSAHNCYNRSGSTYLCVQGGVATCWNIGAAKTRNFESGECFL